MLSPSSLASAKGVHFRRRLTWTTLDWEWTKGVAHVIKYLIQCLPPNKAHRCRVTQQDPPWHSQRHHQWALLTQSMYLGPSTLNYKDSLILSWRVLLTTWKTNSSSSSLVSRGSSVHSMTSSNSKSVFLTRFRDVNNKIEDLASQ